MNKKALYAALAVTPLMSAPALATNWQPYDNHPADAPRAIFAQEEAGVATLLSCNGDGQLSAIISYREGDFSSKMKANAPYRRSVDVSMVRAGVDEGTATWSLIPAVDAIHTEAHSQAAKIYNATILGESVTVRLPREEDVLLELPQVDDTFRAFAATCKPPAAG